MNSPYFITYLKARVMIPSNQLNNNISKYIKDALIEKVQGKCNKYGYVKKIYKVEERSVGEIINEDSSGSVFYTVKYLCKLCKPVNKMKIVCRIVSINKSVIYLVNGPINVVIIDKRGGINENNFVFDERLGMFIAKINKTQGEPLKPGTYVKVVISSSQIDIGNPRIIALGYMDSLATQQEIDDNLMMEENDDLDIVDYDEHVTSLITARKEIVEDAEVDIDLEDVVET